MPNTLRRRSERTRDVAQLAAILTQGESKTKRVRLFTEFVSRRLAAYAPLLAGLSVSRD